MTDDVVDFDAFFVFTIGGNELLRLCSNGDIIVYGNKVETDHAAYDELVEFISACVPVKRRPPDRLRERIEALEISVLPERHHLVGDLMEELHDYFELNDKTAARPQQEARVLANRDYTIVIDKSGSMSMNDCPGGKTRWEGAQEGTEAIARKCATFDPDGITVYMFGSSFKRHDNVTPDKVTQIFAEHEPFGTTDTAGVLSDVFKHWAARKKAGDLKNGETVLVITDGEPNDRQAVSRVIKEVTGQMDADAELAISFLQIGKDQTAQQFLQYLDDGLEAEGAKFDIVDTKTFAEIEEKGMTLTEVLTAAIED